MIRIDSIEIVNLDFSDENSEFIPFVDLDDKDSVLFHFYLNIYFPDETSTNFFSNLASGKMAEFTQSPFKFDSFSPNEIKNYFENMLLNRDWDNVKEIAKFLIDKGFQWEYNLDDF